MINNDDIINTNTTMVYNTINTDNDNHNNSNNDDDNSNSNTDYYLRTTHI